MVPLVTYGIANDVKGWLTTDEVAGWIEIVSNAKSFAELKERQELIQHIMSKMNQVRGEEMSWPRESIELWSAAKLTPICMKCSNEYTPTYKNGYRTSNNVSPAQEMEKNE